MQKNVQFLYVLSIRFQLKYDMIFPPGRGMGLKTETSLVGGQNAPNRGRNLPALRCPLSPEALEWYIIQLLQRKSFVECEQIGFWSGKESFFSVKIKNSSCVLQTVVLVCNSVKIGCFGDFCRKISVFHPCKNQILPISIFGF